jgi:hypothetical protein
MELAKGSPREPGPLRFAFRPTAAEQPPSHLGRVGGGDIWGRLVWALAEQLGAKSELTRCKAHDQLQVRLHR